MDTIRYNMFIIIRKIQIVKHNIMFAEIHKKIKKMICHVNCSIF